MFDLNEPARVARWKAALTHLGLSATVAGIAAILVFVLWFPYPYREISGGRELFFLVVSVDVVMGPLITLVIFNPRKTWRELRKDLAVIALLQLAALGYGLWSVFEARPVQLVYEYGRFGVVHAAELDAAQFSQAPTGITPNPITGPGLVSLRAFKDNAEQTSATLAALAGASLSARIDLWQPYGLAKDDILRTAKPISGLYQRFPNEKTVLQSAVDSTGLQPAQLLYLPLAARKGFWTVLLNAETGMPVGFLPLDSF